MNWLFDNKEWIFSGIGVAALGILGIFFKNNKGSQKQRSGDNSTQLQAGRDMNLKVDGDNDKS